MLLRRVVPLITRHPARSNRSAGLPTSSHRVHNTFHGSPCLRNPDRVSGILALLSRLLQRLLCLLARSNLLLLVRQLGGEHIDVLDGWCLAWALISYSYHSNVYQ